MIMEEENKPFPPCIPYKTFESFMSMLKQRLPTRIDLSYLSDKFSISIGTQLMYAMSFLKLIDINARPTPRLKLLVLATGEHRAALMRQVADESYTFLFKVSLDIQHTTYTELVDVFLNTYGMKINVCRKCINFFLAFCEDAGIPLSSDFVSKRQNLFTNSGKKHQEEAGFIGAGQKSGST